MFTPKLVDVPDGLGPGEIGFFTAAIKQVADTNVGDTITDDRKPDRQRARPASSPAQPVVFCGLFPVDASDFETLREAMGKLRLNDASFTFEMETSAALGFGFRCGFLGPVASRDHPGAPVREFNLDLIATAPSVVYEIALTNGETHPAPQSGRHARGHQDQGNPRALDQGHDPHARRISRRRS